MLTEKNFIEEFYYGRLQPGERFFSENGTRSALCRAISASEHKLDDSLNGEDKDLLEQLIDAQNQLQDVESLESFIDGWKMGAHFVLDTFVLPWTGPREETEG